MIPHLLRKRHHRPALLVLSANSGVAEVLVNLEDLLSMLHEAHPADFDYFSYPQNPVVRRYQYLLGQWIVRNVANPEFSWTDDIHCIEGAIKEAYTNKTAIVYGGKYRLYYDST